MNFRLFGLVVLLSAMASACKSQHGSVAPFDSSPESASSSISEAAAPKPTALETRRMFEHAIFFGPKEGSADAVIEQMAPLIIQEVSADQIANPNVAFFGSIPPVDPPTPTVYFRRESVTIAGILHDRLEYMWWYPSSLTAKGFASQEGFSLSITLSGSGKPLIYETYSRASRTRRYYVSTSLEAATKLEFGQSLAGRKYAIEGDNEEAFAVVGTIDDGPMPLGPYVYLSAGPHREIVAITCRCEKSLANSFVVEPRYELESWDRMLEKQGAGQASQNRPNATTETRSSTTSHGAPPNGNVPSMDKSFRWPSKMPN